MNNEGTNTSSSINFRTLFECSPGLNLVLDPHLKIVAVSQAYLKATMTNRHEILGQYVFDVFPDNPTDMAANGVSRLHQSLLRVLKERRTDYMPIQKYDVRRPESEGGGFEERHWSPVNSPVFGKKDEILYIIHRVEDVTDFIRLRKTKLAQQKITAELKERAEKTEIEIYLRAQEIQKMNAELIATNEALATKEKELTAARDILQHELASGQKDILTLASELTLRRHELEKTMEEMRSAKDQALKASEVKSQFLANMSHEIRTPLGIILGFTELLLNPDISAIERENFVTRIRHSGEHLLDLLSEILDLTKIEAGRMEIEFVDVSIDEMIKEVKSVLETSANKKGLQIQFNIGENLPPTFRSDKTKLRQILINLVSNAVKFCEKGRIEVSVKLDRRNGPSQLLFVVKDTGPGIASTYVDHLFEEFTQADTSMTRKYGGSGLGLALSRRLARALNGDIKLVSTGPGGSTFCASFSLLPQNLSLFPAPAQIIPLFKKKDVETNALEGKNILLVDDSEDNLFLISLLLEKAGARVKTAMNGAEGVAQATANNYDVVLMDIQMPQLNGYDATSLLRSKGYAKPIIALTAHALKEDQEKCLRSGCDAYLAKPVVPHVLVHAIQSTLADAKSDKVLH